MASMDREQLGEWLSAYLDGELSAEESARVATLLRDDPEARQFLAELRELSALVETLPRRTAPESILEDVQRHLERDELIGETPPEAPAAEGWGLRYLATAAAIALMFIGGAWLYTSLLRPGIAGDTVVMDPAGVGGRPGAPDPGAGSALMKDTGLAQRPSGEEAMPAAKRGMDAPTATSTATPPPAAVAAPRKSTPTDGSSPSRGAKATEADLKKEAMARGGSAGGGVLHEAKEFGAAQAGGGEARDMVADGSATTTDATPVMGRLHSMGYLGFDDEDTAERKYQQAVVARAPLEQKLFAVLPATELLGHDFHVESNQLELKLAEPAQVDELSRRIETFLADRDVVNLADDPAAPAERLAGQAFYFEGSVGRNYSEAGERQVIVRLPAEEVPELVDELTHQAPTDDAARMQVGPISARGRLGMTALARQVAGEDVVDAFANAQAETRVAVDKLAAAELRDDDEPVAPLGEGIATEAEQIEALVDMLGLGKSKPATTKEEAAAAENQRTEKVAAAGATASAPGEEHRPVEAAPGSEADEGSKQVPPTGGLAARRLATLERAARGTRQGDENEGDATTKAADAETVTRRRDVMAEPDAPERELARSPGSPTTSGTAAWATELDAQSQTGMPFGVRVEPAPPQRERTRSTVEPDSRGLVTLVIRLLDTSRADGRTPPPATAPASESPSPEPGSPQGATDAPPESR